MIDLSLDIINPDLIINCCAYTDVDKAEKDEKSANILNHLAIKLLAKWCSKNNKKLIHFSTDYIYDGTSRIPISENCQAGPINIYGKTKLLGDIACMSNNSDSIILRTSWLYSSFGNNFVKKMINLMLQNKQLNVISDQIGSPTYAADLAQVIMHIINYKNWIPGIYNYTNTAQISWFDLAKDIRKIYGLKTIINPIKSENHLSIAKRPRYSVLDTLKIKSTYNIEPLPHIVSLNKCIQILKDGK